MTLAAQALGLGLHRTKNALAAVFLELKQLFLENIRCDKWIGILSLLYLLSTVPTLFPGASDAKLLDLVASDEPLITMQLDGMFHRPYGNPANFLKEKNDKVIPDYWGDFRYFNIMYYGGAYLDLGFMVMAPLKALGVKTLPLAPIILRCIACLFGWLTLVCLYNFSKKYFGTLAAVMTAYLLFINYWFWSFCIRIHPDTGVFFLSFFALSVAMHYVIKGQATTLRVQGLLIGFAQGFKSGVGFWFIPMVLLSILWQVKQKPLSFKEKLLTGLREAMIVIGYAVFGFFITTPYAFLDSYYFRVMRLAYDILHAPTPLHTHPITLMSWTNELIFFLGPKVSVFLCLSVLVLGYQFLKHRRKLRPSDLAMSLALCLALSNFLFYALLGKHWVQTYYLVPALGIFCLAMGVVVSQIAFWISRTLHSPLKWSQALGILLFGVLINTSPFLGLASFGEFVRRTHIDKTSNVAMGHWAEKHIPHNSTILYDGNAYFNPAVFHQQMMGTAVLRYAQLLEYKPDYIAITDWQQNWIAEKRAIQHNQRLDTAWNSVRLYQDLIDPTIDITDSVKLGPTRVPYISLVHVVKRNQQALGSLQILRYALCPNFCGKSNLLYGHNLLLYKIDPQFYAQSQRILQG